MKHIIILGDGMADWKIDSLGGKTPLQYADTPYMDLLARCGRTGLLKTVQDGFSPGSEVANSAILGYDQEKVYEGRGPLEAASIGVDLADDDMAIRCNLICIEGDHIKNHSAGHLTTEEARELIDFLQKNLGSDTVRFHSGIQYRHLLVIKGGDKHIRCTPPHDVPGQAWKPLLVKADTAEAEDTASLINGLILKSQELLKDHPVNKKRMAEGKDPANSIWPWSPGNRPKMATLQERYPQLKRGSVITAVDLLRGIGKLAGLRCIDVKGATGLYDTNYEGKAQASIDALKTDDFVYLHIEATDEAGHDGNLDLKLKTIEYLDRRAIKSIFEAVYGKLEDFDPSCPVSSLGEPVAIAVLPDHPTPVAHRTHTNEPVPFLIYAPGIEADSIERFDEESCSKGSYGLLEKDQFIEEFMKIES